MYILKIDISNVEFHLNFQKNINDKIYIELDIVNVEFHLLLDFVKIEFKK